MSSRRLMVRVEEIRPGDMVIGFADNTGKEAEEWSAGPVLVIEVPKQEPVNDGSMVSCLALYPAGSGVTLHRFYIPAECDAWIMRLG